MTSNGSFQPKAFCDPKFFCGYFYVFFLLNETSFAILGSTQGLCRFLKILFRILKMSEGLIQSRSFCQVHRYKTYFKYLLVLMQKTNSVGNKLLY